MSDRVSIEYPSSIFIKPLQIKLYDSVFLLCVKIHQQTIYIARRASWEHNTASVKKFPAFLCSKKYTVWTSQQIVAEPEKIPILLVKAIPVRAWPGP